jgi:Chaperone of endosialidase
MRAVKYALLFIVASLVNNASAQNVGIGITNSSDNLQIHGGSANSAGVSFTNQASGTAAANGMRVGIFYEANNALNQYGFINLPANLPFNIWQGNQRRIIIGSNGNTGIGMAPYNFAALNVNGYGYFFAKGNQGAFVSATDSGTAPTLNGSGFGATKRLSSGLNFINLLIRGDKPQAYIEANFKNGTANQRTSMVMFDSAGNVGIGDYLLDSTLRSRLHLFGSQTVQNGLLIFHGNDDNFSKGNTEIRFSYNRSGFETPGTTLFQQSYHYFIRRNDRDENALFPNPEYKRGTFAIGRFESRPTGYPSGFSWEGDRIAIAQASNFKVGIGRYPSTTDAVHKIFVDGNTHFSASRITLDRPSDDEITTASLEFRNGGTYRGALGWDQSAGRFFFFDGESNRNTYFINNGRFGIQRDPTTNTLEVNGNASKASAGDWLANSDARLKKDIQPLQGALQKLLQLNGITYHWNDDKTGTNRPEGTQMGFTAQNIQQVFPQLVSADAQGFLQTAYGTYDALYVEAIKELLEKMNMLEKKLAALEKNGTKN